MKFNTAALFGRAFELRNAFTSFLKKSRRELEFENYMKSHFQQMYTGFMMCAELNERMGDAIAIVAESGALKDKDPETHDALVTLALQFEVFKDHFMNEEQS